MDADRHQRRLCNFATDKIFFNTNTATDRPGDERVLPPKEGLRMITIVRCTGENFEAQVKWAAVSSALWFVSTPFHVLQIFQ